MTSPWRLEILTYLHSFEPGDLEGLAQALAGDIAPRDVDAARRQAAAFRIEEVGPAWLAVLEGAAGATRVHVRQSRKEAVSGA